MTKDRARFQRIPCWGFVDKLAMGLVSHICFSITMAAIFHQCPIFFIIGGGRVGLSP
jgi:hypothetical protein